MSNTISRVLYQNNHLSRPDVATRLKQPTRDTTGSRIISVRSCFGWGLHSRFCYQKCGELLPRLFTLTCYRQAVIFCCTGLGVTSTGRYPASCPMKPGLSSPAAFRHLQPRLSVLLITGVFYHVERKK